ncbi:MAG: hypothetical protein R3248_10435 [Candidatus Promineifilaceae bacterium]|nr:hypothetical protein [Candidatus Promineifilaceae bacterium]
MKIKSCLHIWGMILIPFFLAFVPAGLMALVMRRSDLSAYPFFVVALFSTLVFLVSVVLAYFVASRLYLKVVRLSCPECGEKLALVYETADPASYECRNCGYSYETNATIRTRYRPW